MTSIEKELTSQTWPNEQLEKLGTCPCCGHSTSGNVDIKAWDACFHTAPGIWKYTRCDQCQSVFLNPRPDEASIGRAYANYFTHGVNTPEDEFSKYQQQSWYKKFRTRLVATYVQQRYGLHSKFPEVHQGLANLLYPTRRAKKDRHFRFLPKPATHKAVNYLLDFGCGNGQFLGVAKGCGYTTEGIEFDPVAAQVAETAGHKIHLGGVERMKELESNSYQVVVISHVIEHLHDPDTCLRECFRILNPGGTLVLETPNATSFGLKKFKKDWRGLEAPRHLLLYSYSQLRKNLSEIGFKNIEDKSQVGVCTFVYSSSHEITQGKLPLVQTKLPLRKKLEIKIITLLGKLFAHRREFISITVQKPV